MEKVTYQPHPDFAKTLLEDPRARLAKVEVKARGKTFVEERKYPKGSPSSDKSTYTTNDELAAKFRDNAAAILLPDRINEAIDALLNLEKVADIRDVVKLVSL